jgi:predicted RNA-binding Zn-ribbon protein involved in translation (DUF1610 family)
MAVSHEKRMFPCPICGVATDVRITKKDKPYITCDPCGVQVFVRGPRRDQCLQPLSRTWRNDYGGAFGNGRAISPDLPEVRNHVLGRTAIGKNQCIRRTSSGLPLP